MKSDINLISSSQIEVVKEKQTVGLLRIAAIASVLLVGILSVALFLIIQALSPSAIKKKEDIVSANISVLRPKQAKLILIKQKIKDIHNIISKRPQYDVIFESVAAKIPQDVSLSTLNLDNQRLTLVASSKSLTSLNDLINNLLEMVKNGQTIKNLTIDNVSVDSAGGVYSISLKSDRT